MSRLLLPLVAVVAASFLPLTAQPDGDDKRPGFRLTLANGDAKDVTSARLVALYVPAGTRPSPFVPAGPFTATWQGDLTFELPEELAFSAEGRGKLVVKLKDQVLLDLSGDDFAKSPGKKVEVPGEPTPLTVTYQAPATGDAFVRLSWKGENFVREPVAFTFARHDATTKEQKASAQVRQGRELTAHLHCVKCHAVEKAAMPELAADAPSLATIGGRVHEPWLAHWVQDPHALRPQATMPKLLGPSEKGPGQDARDLAAYLAGLGWEAQKDEPPPADETVAKGARLFSHLGCVSCHLMPAKDEFKDEEHDRLPLRHVAAKWKPAALRAFLRKPTAHYAAIRMPDFGLSADEADQLAAFLSKTSTRSLGDGPYEKGDAKRGKELLAAKGCLACHAAEDKKLSPPKTLALADLKKADAGCLADAKPGGKVPAFALTDGQRDALRASLAAGPAAFQLDAPIDLAERTLTHLRCYSCHQRDGREDAWSRLRDEGDALLNEYPGDDAEKDPIGQPYPAVQLRPPLTWTGEKLRPEWLAAFLGGKVEYKPRPYLRARMPHFAGPMDQVALGLALQHGRPPKSPPPPVDEKMADAGRTLAAKKNWGCIACHNVGKTVAAEAFEAPGINFAHVRDRLTRDYFDRWVYSPLRVEPGTKMPAVFQIGRKSLLDQFFDGDADKQVEALWQYLQKGDKIQFPPE